MHKQSYNMKGNVIICGAPRSGTTALYRYLSSHPLIATSPVKEMNYFLGGEFWNDTYRERSQPKESYNNSFSDFKEGMWSLEASPGYMHPSISKDLSKRINNVIPKAKLIFLLRNPMTRMLSHFNTEKRSLLLDASMTFEEFTRANFDSISKNKSSNSNEITSMIGMEIGCYAKALRDFLSNNDTENILIIFTENLLENTELEMKKISTFIGIDESFYNDYSFIKENQYHQTRNKHLYLLAGKINRKLEPFLNKSPQIRHYIRYVYNILNTTENKNIENHICKELSDKLNEYFSHCNQDLEELLLSIHIDNTEFPEWLRKG